MDFGTRGVVGGAYAEASKAKGKTNTDATSYTASEITAADKLNIRSGKDTNIIGSKVSGNKVEANVGGNLNIESLQEQSSYESKSTSGGVSVTYSPLGGVTGNASASSNKLDNSYKSVTEQAGIYAGSEGFDINVKGNTDLKGAVIDSTATADKNSLTTGTLSVSDIANSSETKSSGRGLSYDGEKSNSSTSMLGDKGLIPNIPMATNESDSSITKSGIAEGSITITKPSEQKQDVSQINRNTEGTANVLKNSFDPQKVQERQETAALFGELAANAIHEIAKRNGWKDGSPEKIAMHAAVGAVMAGITKGDITAAAITGGSTEALSNTIIKAVGNDKGSSAEAQWAAAVVGAALSSATGGDAQNGASIAANAVKNNHLTEEEVMEMREKTAKSRNTGYLNESNQLSGERDKQWHEAHEKEDPIGLDSNGVYIYKAYLVGKDVNGNDQYLFGGPGNKGFIIDKNIAVPSSLKDIIDNFDYTQLKTGEIKSVSVDFAIGKFSGSMSYSVSSDGDKFTDIKLLTTLIPNIVSGLEFGLNYSEGIYKVIDFYGRRVTNRDIIRSTMTGTGIYGGFDLIGSGKNATFSPDTKCTVISADIPVTIGTSTMSVDVGAGLSFGKQVKLGGIQ